MTPADGARAHGPVRAPVRTDRPAPVLAPRLLAGAAILAAALSRPATRAALAALACVALLSAAAPAQAQTVTTLVGNHEGKFRVSRQYVDQIVAQRFTTGGNPLGYTLSDIRIRLANLPLTLPAGAVVKIRRNTSGVFLGPLDVGRPGNHVVTLTNPSSFTANAFNTFTAPANTTLARNRTYWVTVNEDSGDNGVRVGFPLTSASVAGLRGWSMYSVPLSRATSTDNWYRLNVPPLMGVRGWVTGGASVMTLSALGLTAGGDAVPLTPAFDKENTDILRYTALVDEGVSRVTVTATPTDSNARIDIHAVPGATRTLDVPRGRSETRVTVTATDEVHKRTYVVIVGRGSSDATLTSLGVSDGSNDVPLTPALAGDTTDYRARVAESVSSVTVQATPSDDAASIIFSRLLVTSGDDYTGADSATYGLRHGANTLKVIALAQNGFAFKTYEVQIIREGPAPQLEYAAVRGKVLRLVYDRNVRGEPPASAYTVQVDGVEVAVTSTAVVAKSVYLTLARTVTHRERNVKVSYTLPSLPDNAVQTPLGGRAAALTDRAVQTVTPPSGPGTGGVSGKQLFYAKMSVADDRINQWFGYNRKTGFFTSGSMSVVPPEFTLAGERYTVERLVVDYDGTLSLNLTGTLTQDAAANLALYVGGTRFRFADGVYDDSGNQRDWSGSGLSWAADQSVPVLVVDANKAPVFEFEDWRRYVFENPDGVVDVEAPIVATDPDGHTLTGYTLAGRDADKFTIDASTGQLRTKADVVYDYETQGTCVVKFSFTVESGGCFNVVVQATDRYGAVGEKPVAVFLLNDKYDPTVQAVRVEAVAGTAGVLRLSWVAPEKRPTGYEVWYSTRDTATGGNVKRPGADATSLEIPFLEADTEYHVQIRARFDDSDTNIYYDPERGSYGQGPWTKVRARTGAAIPGAKPAVSLGLPKGVKVRGTGARRVVRLRVGDAARLRIEVSDIVNSHKWRARRPVGIKVCYRDYWRDPSGQAPVFMQGGCPAGQSTGLAVLADDGFAVTSGTTAHVELVKQINSAALESGPYRATLGPGLDYRLETGAVTELCFEVATDVGFVPNPCTRSTPPGLLSAALLGQSGDDAKVVVLQFDERLRQERLPTRGAFTVRAGGEPVRLDRVARGDNDGQLKLTLGVPVKKGQSVTVSYRAPGFGGVLQDADGNRVPSFAGVTVTHSSTVTGPAPLSARRNPRSSQQVFVLFDVPLDFDNLPAVRTFRVDSGHLSAGGTRIGQNPDTSAPNRDREVIVRASISLPPRTVTVSYSDPTTDDDTKAIQDTAGTDAASFRIVVTTPPPVLESATVPAAGDLVELIFDRALDAAAGRTPPASAFTVTLDDDDMEATDLEITAVAVSGTAKRVRLTVMPRIRDSQNVTVSYVDSGPDAAIQNTDGVDAASFADEAVTNNSEVAPPVLESATVPAAGDVVDLIFDRALDDAAGRTPPANAFTVTADDEDVRVSSVAVSGSDRRVRLTISPIIKQNRSVRVSYADPDPDDGRAIRHTEGDAAADFANQKVTNDSTVPDPNAPAPVSARLAYVSGAPLIRLALSLAVDTDDGRIHPGAFAAIVDGTRHEGVFVFGVVDKKGEEIAREIHLEFAPGVLVDFTTVTLEYTDDPQFDNEEALQSRSGVDAASFTIAVDLRGTPPEVQSATVPAMGDLVELIFDQALDDTAALIPPRSAFTVTVDDDDMPATDYEITGVTVSGTAKRVRLAVTPRIREGQSVTVSYADPGSDRVIRNANGVDAASFADEVVTNNSMVGPPKLRLATVPVAGNLVELIFDRALEDAAGRTPPPSAFTVTVDDVGMDATDHEIIGVTVSGTDRRVRLEVMPRIEGKQTQRVTVSYRDSGPDAAIQDAYGVDAASFTTGRGRILNSSGFGPPEIVIPYVAEAGNLVLIFDEVLDDTVQTPPASAFTVTVDGEDVPVISVAISGPDKEVRLTVSPTIKQGQYVRVFYTDPDPDDDSAIRNLDGEDLRDFANIPVNESTVPNPIPPSAVRAALDPEDNSELFLTFSSSVDFDNLPSTDDFTLTYDDTVGGSVGLEGAITLVEGWNRSPPILFRRQILLTVSFGAVRNPTSITLTYTDPTSDNDAKAIQNLDGVDAASFTIDLDLSRGLSLSVADVTVAEAAGATADFVVTLRPAAAAAVTVDYATSDGTAIAGSDYTATSGTLTFLAGETTKTVSVPVTDDAHEDSGETFTLTLSNASGARIDDATATATITNDDPAAALAAAFQEMPATHDGSAAFSFELAFTEEPQSGFRRATLRDSSLEVTGGEVTAVRRLERGKNKAWEVTVTLPARTDCAVAGAVCTTDGRAIEVSLSAEVAGPDTGLDPAPRVTGASVVNGPGPNGAWDAGETVQAEVRFNAAVAVHGPPGVMPALAIVLDGERREAAYTGGAGTQTLTFAYPVVAADAGARRAWMAANGLILNGVVLRDNLEREAETDFGAVPYVTAVELVADASGDDIWTPGETIEAQLTFSEAVTVAGGAPTLKVTVAGKVTTLDYASGSGSTVLVFSRAVTDSSGTQSRIAVTADSLALGGARIVSTASGRAAAPGHDGTEATTATAALTAAFRNVPPEHDGTAFTLDLAFSEAPGSGLGAETLLDAALSATGGQVTEVSRLQEGSNRRWRLTVAPDGAGEVSVTLAATADCAAEGAICTDDERPLAAAVTATVRAQLTVAFERVPEEHDGTGPIFFSFAFSEEPGTVTYQSMRTESLVMHLGGERILWGSGERPEKPKKRRWRVGVSLSSSPAAAGKADLTVEIAPRDTCEDTGAVCTPDGRMLSHTLSAVIQGPPGVSVADAPAPEAGASTLDFTVTLSRAAAETVTVDYASADGPAPDGATAGEDYTAASGTLTFAPGETGKTVPVAVLDDADDGETVTLTLTNASGNHAWLAEARATGTISNPDTAIRVTGVSVISGPGDNGTWDAGETVTAEVRFSAAVTVDGPPGTAPTLALLLDGTRREAVYTDGSGTQTLSFSHTVTAADAGALRARVAANGLALDGVTLAGAHGEDVETGFAVAPYVTAVELMPDASGDRSWTPGEMLEVRLTFSEAVTVAGGAPTLKVTAAGAAATLDYVSGPSSAVLVFSRAVTGTDGSFSQIALTADSLALGGASVVSAVSGLSAALGHDGTAATEPVLLRGRVALGAAFLDLPAEGHGGAAFTLKLQFSEEFPLSWQTPADSGIAVTNGTLTGLVRVTAGENREWTVTVTPDGGDDVTLTLPATTDCAAAKAICNGDDVPLSAAVSVTVPATAQQTQEQASTQPTVTASTLWSSTLTVGEPDFFGFIGSGNGGSLSSDGWSEDGRRHTVGQVDLALYPDRANELWVEFSPVPGNIDDLTLHVGESVKALSAALTAAFLELPADGHDGSAFTLKLRFSENLADDVSDRTLRNSALSVTNGTLTGVARVSAGENREWTVTVTPDGDAAVTVTLAATADCAAANALCTGDNRPLSAALSVTVAGPEPGEPEEPAGEPLTVRFESIPAEHDGRSAVVFRLAFSEAPHQFGYRTLRDETLRIRQGEARPASKARRLDSSSNRRWEVTYQPVSNAAITVALGPTLACGDDGAVCTENGRRLSNTVSTVIPGPPGLSVADAQVEEAAQATVDFTVILSRAAAETVTLEYATADGTAVAGEDYTAAAGTLSFSPGQTTRTVPVAVLDDPHDEGSETFTLALSNPSGNHAWLSAARATGTISNSDPLPKGWLARFGRTSATQVLGLLDARFGEARAPASQLTLGGRPVNLAVLSGRQTPAHTDPFAVPDPSAGPTAASPLTLSGGQADSSVGSAAAHTDPFAIPDPSAGPTAASPHALNSGQVDPAAGSADPDADPFDVLASRYTLDDTAWGMADLNSGPAAMHADPAAAPDPAAGAVGAGGTATLLERLAWKLLTQDNWSVDRRQFLSGSSFDLSLSALGRETDAEQAAMPAGAGHWSLWGRGALTRFAGRERGLSLDGDVLTGLLGLDYSRGRWLAGVGLAYNDGAYRAPDSGAVGELDSTLVSVHPYLHYALTDRLSAWGTLGYGGGTLSLRPARAGDAGNVAGDVGNATGDGLKSVPGEFGESGVSDPIETGMQMRMGALGLRGTVFANAATELALKTDLMWVRTTSAATAGMVAVDGADASRVRLLLTGRHRHVLATGAALTPNFELGLRYDDGAAETGAGVELGGGLQYADPALGLSVEATARALLAHEAGGYEEWGLSGSLQLDPGRLGRGLSLRLASGWGLTDSSTDALWQQQTASGLARGPGQTPQGRFLAEWCYGLDVPWTHGLLTPYGGVEMAAERRTLRLGWRFELGQLLSLSLAGERHEAPHTTPEHGLMLQTALPW